jgi:hypothetical protein
MSMSAILPRGGVRGLRGPRDGDGESPVNPPSGRPLGRREFVGIAGAGTAGVLALLAGGGWCRVSRATGGDGLARSALPVAPLLPASARYTAAPVDLLSRARVRLGGIQ